MTTTYRSRHHHGKDGAAMGPAGEDGPFGGWGSQVYGLVADRLRKFTANQADRTWTLRHSDPLAPHGLAVFYLDPVGDARPQLATGWRMFRDGEHVGDAAALLYELGEVARGYHRAGQLDPRTQMLDVHDEMSPAATYAGIALSTLDTPNGTWRQVRGRATGSLTIPVRALAWLVDNTMMLVDRREHRHVNDFTVACTRLGPDWRNPREWRVCPELATEHDSATYDLWVRLWELHTVMAQADHARR